MRHDQARELSGGQSMLLQIARALMLHPLHLLLMDEPFAGVHPTIKETILATILRMNREEGVTFLVVSHEMAELRRLCPRVSVMHEGRLIAEGHARGGGERPGRPRGVPGRLMRWRSSRWTASRWGTSRASTSSTT